MLNELNRRMKALQNLLEREKLDSYIVTTEDNIWYLSNITYKPEERPFFIVVSINEKPVLIVPKLEEAHLMKIKIDCKIVSYWEYPSTDGANWFDILGETIKTHRRVGVESHIKADLLKKIDAEVEIADLIDEIRMVKSEYELAYIRRTAQICDEAMSMIFKSAYDGGTVVEPFTLSRSIQKNLIQSKQYDPITTSLLTAVWPAPNSAMPHSVPELSDKMGKGPNVAMSYFRINGYAAECERTFFLGEPSEEEKEHFNNMIGARNLALSLVKPGVRCSDIDTEVKNFLVSKGYGENLLHRTGHGIGLGNHEAPWLAEGSDHILQENMVVSIEPGIYFTEVGGYRHSDTVLITRDGYELLTKFPVELKDVTITSKNTMNKIKGKVIQRILKLD